MTEQLTGIGKKKKSPVTYVKKNYIDPTSGFLYALGCSLVHFALFVSIWFVENPNVERAVFLDNQHIQEKISLGKALDPEYDNFCGDHAKELVQHASILKWVHGLSVVVCLYREVYENGVGWRSQLMKGFEILFAMANIGCLSLIHI